jgi:hypothetical protein
MLPVLSMGAPYLFRVVQARSGLARFNLPIEPERESLRLADLKATFQ